MGLGPIMAIYQARFNEYLKDRGLKDTTGQKVWAFLGDGECDEPETLGALTLASREKLDNLIFVINCNLQRLDGPVRGNGKIIQELEGLFRGAGWNVIKVVWGSDWDVLLEKDQTGLLAKRMAKSLTASTKSTRSCQVRTSASTSLASTPNCCSWSPTTPTKNSRRCVAVVTIPRRSTRLIKRLWNTKDSPRYSGQDDQGLWIGRSR